MGKHIHSVKPLKVEASGSELNKSEINRWMDPDGFTVRGHHLTKAQGS